MEGLKTHVRTFPEKPSGNAKKKNKKSKNAGASKRYYDSLPSTTTFKDLDPMNFSMANTEVKGSLKKKKANQKKVTESSLPTVNSQEYTSMTTEAATFQTLDDGLQQYGYSIETKAAKKKKQAKKTKEVNPEDVLEIKDEEVDVINDFQEDITNIDDEDEIETEAPDEEEIIMKEFRENLANMPISKLKELRNKLGIKLFNKTFFGVTEEKALEDESERLNGKAKNFKRENSKRPREISSKKPVSKFRDIYANEKKRERISIDPRFDSRYGEFNEAIFERNYTHVQELQHTEMNAMKNELKSAKAAGEHARANKLKETLRRMEDRIRTKKDRELKRQTLVDLKKENINRMKEGLAPVFKTRAEVRNLQEERKKARLQKEGQLDKHLERKEKKQKLKEKRLKKKLSSIDHGLR